MRYCLVQSSCVQGVEVCGESTGVGEDCVFVVGYLWVCAEFVNEFENLCLEKVGVGGME